MESEFVRADKIRKVLITKTAIKTLKPEQLVEKVINFQFKDLLEATKTNNSVEISWFGKFLLSPTKLINKIGEIESLINKLTLKLEDTELSETKRIGLQSRLKYAEDYLIELKERQNESGLERTS